MGRERECIAVIGAGSGIGLATSDLLSASGVGVRKLDVAGSEVGCEHFDVTSEQHWAALHVDQFDGVVLTAGIRSRQKTHEISAESFMRTMEVNVLGAGLAVRSIAESVVAARDPRVKSLVLLSSAVTAHSVPGQLAYNASKAAVSAIARSGARELGPAGIRVNAVAPGSILTPMTESGWSDDEHSEAMRLAIPAGRPGLPKEVASLICFLLSDSAAYINGSVLVSDGGWTA